MAFVVFDQDNRRLLQICESLNALGIDDVVMVQSIAAIKELLCIPTGNICSYCLEFSEDEQQHICKCPNLRAIISPKLFPCTTCNEGINYTLKKLKDHCRKVHNLDDQTCVHCLKRINSSMSLNIHKRAHWLERKQTSKDAHYAFLKNEEAALLKHLQPFDSLGKPALALMSEACYEKLGPALKIRMNDFPISVLPYNPEPSNVLDNGASADIKLPTEEKDVNEPAKEST